MKTLDIRDPAFLARAAGAGEPTLSVTTNLIARWEADSIMGLSDGDPVTTWPDTSGSSRDLSGGGVTRPLFKTNIFGTKPAVRFDGSDDQMSFTLASATNFTVFVAWQLKSIQAWTFGPLKWRNGSSGAGFSLVGDSATTSNPKKHLTVWNGGGTEICNQAGPDESLSLPGTPRGKAIDTWRWNGTTCTMKKNGSSQSTAGGAGGYGIAGGQNVGFPYNYCGGDVAAILVYDTNLSDGDVGLVETYLNAKFPCF